MAYLEEKMDQSGKKQEARIKNQAVHCVPLDSLFLLLASFHVLFFFKFFVIINLDVSPWIFMDCLLPKWWN